jgi:sortase A
MRWIARLLIAGGAAALIWVAFHFISAEWYQRQQQAALETLRSASTALANAPKTLAVGKPIGTLTIPRVKLTAVVVEGDEDAVLDRAVGHLPDTPLPWLPGNSAIAAHRDTLFRPLKDIRLGDVLRLTTPHGDFDYRVKETLIVKPEDVWVLDPTPVSTLTLISCYPFYYVGHAPERFVVRAERIPTLAVTQDSKLNTQQNTQLAF